MSNQINAALQSRDSEALYTLAEVHQERGDVEVAEALLATARRIDNEDLSYDREIDNNL